MGWCKGIDKIKRVSIIALIGELLRIQTDWIYLSGCRRDRSSLRYKPLIPKRRRGAEYLKTKFLLVGILSVILTALMLLATIFYSIVTAQQGN